jgi:hypothetical protein
LTQFLFDAVVTYLIVVGLCFLPKWLWWIIPHANSIYDALSMIYGKRRALLMIALGSLALSGGILLAYWGSKSHG